MRTGVLLFTCSTLFIWACGDDGQGATDVAPTSTSITGASTLDPTTDDSTTDEPATTEQPTSTTTDSNATTTASTSDGPGSDSGGDPLYCVPSDPADNITCEKMHREWCDEAVAAAEAAGLPPAYVDVVAHKCAQGDQACGVCFYIENTCNSLVGNDTCNDVMYTCGCLAAAHEVL